MGMSKYDRLLYILNLLRVRRNLNAGRLADECGVTERSIYRDMVALSEANIPIYYDNGYKLASDSFLPPLNFNYDEYLCLKTALDSSPLKATGKYAELMKRLLIKLEACLSESVRKQSRFTPSAMHIEISMTQEQEKAERFYGVIENAVTHCRPLELTYESIGSGLTERVVEPYFIIFRGNAFYFVAYCRLREDFRTFRIDRVVDVEPTQETFVKRDGIEAESYFQGSWSVFGGEPVKVVVRFTGAAARVVASGSHHRDETVEPVSDDEVNYSVVCRGLEEIKRWILGFGAEAEVIEPEELRQELAEIGGYLYEKYGT